MKNVTIILSFLACLVATIETAPLQQLGGFRTPDVYLIPHLSFEISATGYYRHVERPSYVDPDKNGLILYGMLGVGLFNWVQIDALVGDYV